MSSNIIEFNMLHSFGHNVAWCWVMLNEVWFPSNIVFNIVQHFFCSQVWTMLHSFGHCIQHWWTHACPLRWLCGYLYPWRWLIVYICFIRCRVSIRATVWRTSKVLNLSKTELSSNRKGNGRTVSKTEIPGKASRCESDREVDRSRAIYCQTNMAQVCFQRILGRFWSQTLRPSIASNMLHPFGHLV